MDTTNDRNETVICISVIWLGSLFTCFKSLVNLLLLFLCCSFNGWHFEWYLSRWSTGASNVQAQIFTHPLDVCVCFFYLLPSHEASERRTRFKTMHTELMQTRNMYTIFCAPIVHLIHITLYHRIVSTQLFLLSVYIYCITLTDLNFISLHCYIIRTHLLKHIDVFVYECKWKEITKPCKGLLAH